MSEEALFLSFLGMETYQSFFHIIKVVKNIYLMYMKGCFTKVNIFCAQFVVLTEK
jgi:hypothetical protein